MSKQYDNVNPKHYAGDTSLECIECMRLTFGRKAVYYFCLCNAFKYMWRFQHKNGKEDLNKARWYINYVQHDIEMGFTIPKKILNLCQRINDLHIDIGDKISNGYISLKSKEE